MKSIANAIGLHVSEGETKYPTLDRKHGSKVGQNKVGKIFGRGTIAGEIKTNLMDECDPERDGGIV